MANTFFRKLSSNVGTVANTIGSYTVGGSTTSIVLGLALSNTSGGTINASAFVANATALTYLVKNAPITTGGTLIVVGGDQKLVLEAGDYLRVQTSAADSADAL